MPSHVWLFATPWTAVCQASLSLTISWSLPNFMSIALVMPSSHLTLWHPLLFLHSIFPSIRDFSNELACFSIWVEFIKDFLYDLIKSLMLFSLFPTTPQTFLTHCHTMSSSHPSLVFYTINCIFPNLLFSSFGRTIELTRLDSWAERPDFLTACISQQASTGPKASC